jgi:hypothetical protein
LGIALRNRVGFGFLAREVELFDVEADNSWL